MKNIIQKIKDKREILFEFIAILLIVLFSYSIAPKTLQNDTYYTVSIGNLILENGIDMKDHFSWHENLPYTYPHWLYDVIMGVIYNFGDWKGIYISVCILSAILGITIYKVNKSLAKNQILSFIITICSMYLLKDYIAARAQLVTFIIYMLIIYFIEKFLENPKKIRYGAGIFLSSVLIANLHVAVWPFIFILSLPYIAEYFISIFSDIIIYNKLTILKNKIILKISKNESRIEKVNKSLESINNANERIKIKRENDEPYKIRMNRNKNVKWVILLMLLCGLSGLLTPIGTTPYTYLYKTMVGNTLDNINEHLPLTLINNKPIMITIVIILSITTFTKIKIKLSDLFMLGGLSYLMFLSKRQSTMLVLIGSIILNKMIIEMIEVYITKDIKEINKKLINIVTVLACSILIIFLSKNYIHDKKYAKYVRNSTYPVEASEWILENLDINNMKLFNEYNYGSYLLYKGIPVFIDSRADLYAPEFNNGEDIFSDFINTSNLGKYYGSTFEKYGITHVILYKNSKVSMIIDEADSEKYDKIYSDDNFVIYEVLN